MTTSGFRDIAAMAFRNLARHRVKTVITTVAVAVSVALYIFMDAWLLGMNLESRRNIVSYETGAAKIQTPAYFAKKDELPMYENFGGWESLAAALEAEGYAAAPRFVFSGTLYSRWGTAPMAFNAVDPDREPAVLRYASYLEAGRFPRPGKLEAAIGTMAADKLRLGIPRRIERAEFESDILPAARTEAERAFIEGLYGPAERGPAVSKPFSVPGTGAGGDYLVLRDPLSAADRDRLWELLAASGRMDVRISTVIDTIAAPESVRKEKFERDLLPSLTEAGRAAVGAAYGADPVTGDYRLSAAEGSAEADAALRAMLDVQWPGAVRHVNQLIDAVVVGVVNSPNPKTNANVAFLPLDALQDEAGLMLGGRATELLVRKAGARDEVLPGRTESPGEISAALERAGINLGERGLEVYGWKDYAADYIAASTQDNVSSRIMIVMLFILSFIGIANTMLMAILERTKETGMLRALGMTDGQLILSYALEAGMIGALGSAAGMVLGSLLNIPMVAYGIDYSAMAAEMSGDYGYRVTAFFRSAWNPLTIALSGVVATVLSAATAIPPTLRALRMPVTESLRFE
jgi:ABC-type lipoprotein release transport system permease subunit